MGWFGTFWRQPARRYRNFQLVFLVLTLNFVLPALSYTFNPEAAMAQFLQVNRVLGGSDYTFPEAASRVWRYLAAANVKTLGYCCFLLQYNLRRYYVVRVPLTFMKAYAASCWWVGWALAPEYRFFLAAAVLDSVSAAAFFYFSRTAHDDIAGRPDAELVPAPRGSA